MLNSAAIPPLEKSTEDLSDAKFGISSWSNTPTWRSEIHRFNGA